MREYATKYPVDLMSRVLNVSRSGYYNWLKINQQKSKEENIIHEEVREIFHTSNQTYGSPRVTTALEKQGIIISKSKVSRIMKALKITVSPKKKYVVTTQSDHEYDIPENLLNREFNVSEINKVWVSDITYIPVGIQWMYLTTVIDLADRMVIGWCLSDNMTARETSIKAFNIAVKNRGLTKQNELMFHSDRGVQYACHEFKDLLMYYNCTQSMSRKGNCWDNAVAESFFKTIKSESLNHCRFRDFASTQSHIFRYIDGGIIL